MEEMQENTGVFHGGMERILWLMKEEKWLLPIVFIYDGLVQDMPVKHDERMYQRPYERLIVWQEAHKLFLWVNDLTGTFPAMEKFALADQMRRSAYSVPMNIAEGNSRRTKKDKRRFLDIAASSLEELHCQLRIGNDLHYISQENFKKGDAWIHRVSYLLTRLHQSLR